MDHPAVIWEAFRKMGLVFRLEGGALIIAKRTDGKPLTLEQAELVRRAKSFLLERLWVDSVVDDWKSPEKLKMGGR